MNTIRRLMTTHRHRLLKLTPLPLIQHQHASSYTYTTTTKSVLRTPKSPKLKSQPLNDIVLKEPPKPSEIPWQAKVVNSVSLIGQVKIPVQFEKSPDGKNWAGTIISQDDAAVLPGSLPSFWIPVIFEGDLAHVAKCHLKEKDFVHVAGYLSVDVPPFKLTDVQVNVQVMVHSINFVQDSKSMKVSTPLEPERWSTKTSVPENNVFAQPSMKEPDTMSIQPHTLFEKSTVNGTESSPVHNSTEVGRKYSDRKVDKRSMLANWRDLVTNSKQWLDNRERKRKGLVKENYPDFKHNDTGDGLWLDKAPAEVLQGLGQLEFCVLPTKAAYFRKADFPATPTTLRQTPPGQSPGSSREKDSESWKHLVENPKQWWDNRLDKKNKKGPDFKNKDSGKALWLGDAPAWAASSLPPLKS